MDQPLLEQAKVRLFWVLCVPNAAHPFVYYVPLTTQTTPSFSGKYAVSMTAHPPMKGNTTSGGPPATEGVGTEMFFDELEGCVSVSLGTKLTWAGLEFAGGAEFLTGCI